MQIGINFIFYEGIKKMLDLFNKEFFLYIVL